MNTSTIDPQEYQVCRDMAAKGHLGAVMYLVIWMLVTYVSPINDDYPVLTTVVLILLAVSGFTRGYYGLRFETLYKRSPRRWLIIYVLSVLGTALTWGMAAAFTLWFYTLEWTGFLAVFSLGGLVAGGSVSMSTHYRLVLSYIFAMLIPVIVICTLLGDPVALTLGALFAFDIVYLSIVAKRLNYEYWSAVRLNALLSERAIELEEARNRAELLDRAKSNFLSHVNHELRTPLNSIIGFARVLSRSRSLSQTDQEHVSIINRSGGYLLKLINHVLELSKIEAGKTTVDKSAFDLKSLLDEISDMFSIRAEKNNLELLFEVSEEVPRYIESDELKLRQVLINLLSNAIKFTDKGSVKLSVTKENINESQLENQVAIVFSVADTGAGISPEDKDNIFKSFNQSAAGRVRSEGTGLGLTISKNFVELLGGTIVVQSEIDKGSNFTFVIYPVVVAAPKYTHEGADMQVRALESNADVSVLVVDDMEDNRKLLVDMLEPVGFKVLTAENGAAAVEAHRKKAPDIILMDLMMPVMDGFEAITQIRSISNSERTPIIACTAEGFDNIKQKALKAGFDDFLRKPFDENEMFSVIKNHVPINYQYYPRQKDTPSIQDDSSRNVPNQIEADNPENNIDFTAMREAIDVGDMDLIHTQIELLRDNEPNLANRLDLLMNDFAFDEIISVINSIDTKDGETKSKYND